MEPLVLETLLVQFAYSRRISSMRTSETRFGKVPTARTPAIAHVVKKLHAHASAVEVACMGLCFFFLGV